MSILHRIEKYGYNNTEMPFLELSFNTEYRGIWQCRLTPDGMDQFASEPPLESLKKSEQEEIIQLGLIVFKFTFDEVPNL